VKNILHEEGWSDIEISGGEIIDDHSRNEFERERMSFTHDVRQNGWSVFVVDAEEMSA
jgi:hypothetical protein